MKGQPIGVSKAPKYNTNADGHVIVNAQGIPTSAPDKEVIGKYSPISLPA